MTTTTTTTTTIRDIIRDFGGRVRDGEAMERRGDGDVGEQRLVDRESIVNDATGCEKVKKRNYRVVEIVNTIVS